MAGESFLGLEPGTFGNQPTPPRLLEQIDYLYSSTGTMLQHSHKDGVVLEDGAVLPTRGAAARQRAAAGSAGGDAQLAEHLSASRSDAAPCWSNTWDCRWRTRTTIGRRPLGAWPLSRWPLGHWPPLAARPLAATGRSATGRSVARCGQGRTRNKGAIGSSARARETHLTLPAARTIVQAMAVQHRPNAVPRAQSHSAPRAVCHRSAAATPNMPGPCPTANIPARHWSQREQARRRHHALDGRVSPPPFAQARK